MCVWEVRFGAAPARLRSLPAVPPPRCPRDAPLPPSRATARLSCQHSSRCRRRQLSWVQTSAFDLSHPVTRGSGGEGVGGRSARAREKDSGCARVGGNGGTRGMRHATSSAYHARLHPGALCAPAAAYSSPTPFSLMHIVLNAWQVINRLTRDRQKGWAGPYFNILGPPAASYWRAPTLSQPTKTTASPC